MNDLEAGGDDNVTFETDYPHPETSWPHSRETAWKMLGHLPRPTVDKILRGNATRMLGLDR